MLNVAGFGPQNTFPGPEVLSAMLHGASAIIDLDHKRIFEHF